MINDDYRRILTEDILNPIMELTKKKAADYAQDGDTLSNFKIQAQMQSELLGTEVSPADVALQFVIVKLVRLANLRDKEPQNESVLDTIRDAINYLGLHYACRVDSAPVCRCSEGGCSHPESMRMVQDSTRLDGCQEVFGELLKEL
jgi:hypothetical protein